MELTGLYWISSLFHAFLHLSTLFILTILFNFCTHFSNTFIFKWRSKWSLRASYVHYLFVKSFPRSFVRTLSFECFYVYYFHLESFFSPLFLNYSTQFLYILYIYALVKVSVIIFTYFNLSFAFINIIYSLCFFVSYTSSTFILQIHTRLFVVVGGNNWNCWVGVNWKYEWAPNGIVLQLAPLFCGYLPRYSLLHAFTFNPGHLFVIVDGQQLELFIRNMGWRQMELYDHWGRCFAYIFHTLLPHFLYVHF